jgi:TolB-like protein/DNA-binding winged helix-turn-helix (wHTH) protein
MGDSNSSRGVLRFGVFEADLDAGELRKGGTKIHMQEQPFQVLSVLLQRAGDLVSREELRQQVWGERTFVEFDHALNTAIKKIRIAIDDDAATPQYIETIPKRGYRFIAPVQQQTVTAVEASGDVVLPHRVFPPWVVASAVFAMIVLASLALLIVGGPTSPSVHSTRRVVLAVLPFENSSGDAAQEQLCDGLTQELITQLGRVDPSRLGVAARSRVLPYRNASKTVAQIGTELGADYLMEGNLRRDGSHVRVTAELIRARDQVRLWGDVFDNANGDEFLTVEMEIAKAITDKVREDALLAMQ